MRPEHGSAVPSREVLAAFGVREVPAPVSGGQGTAWRAGDVVLKPGSAASFVEWQASLLARLAGRDDVRVSTPLPSLGGGWVVEGWSAWRWQPGVHRPGRWPDVVEAGKALHVALRDEPCPAFLSSRTDRWAVADRVAWGEVPCPLEALDDQVQALLGACRPLDLPAQLVHGDLTGNVLFHPELPPLVIDLSPYWRPPGYAYAVVAADVLVWHGGDARVVDALIGDDGPQLLLRALVFRLVTDLLDAAGDREADAYRRAVGLALGLAGA